MSQSFDILYVTSPGGTQLSLLKLWLCGQNGIIQDVTEFTLTNKLKQGNSWFETTRPRFLISPSGWIIFKSAPNGALGTKKDPPSVHQSMVSFKQIHID